MGSHISHFLENDVEGLGDFMKGIKDGVTGDFSDARRDFKNVGHAWINAYGGKNQAMELSEAEIQNKITEANKMNYNKMLDPNNGFNKSIASRVTAVNSQYSQLGVIKPTDLMKISDPAQKMSIAGSRGVMRQGVDLVNAQTDIGASSQLASAVVAPKTTSS